MATRRPIDESDGKQVWLLAQDPDLGPKISSLGLKPWKTATSAKLVSPSSACSSYGFAIRSACTCALTERSPSGCKSGVTIWLRPLVVAPAFRGVSKQKASAAKRKIRPMCAVCRSRENVASASRAQMEATRRNSIGGKNKAESGFDLYTPILFSFLSVFVRQTLLRCRLTKRCLN